jgi:plastocyanin
MEALRTLFKFKEVWAGLAAVILAAAFWFLLRPAAIHTVELREEGFVPETIWVSPGDTVRFVNLLDKPFWPASNLHPTHEMYPEFDPKEPVPAGSSWSFRFRREGTWPYHDHLSPYYRGIVTVGGETAAVPAEACENPHSPACWEARVEAVLKSRGIEAAFAEMRQILAQETQAGKSCHALTHRIGEEAYRLFAQSDSVTVTENASLCGYGFYHGFLEKLVVAEGDPARAEQFCEMVNQKLNEKAALSCYHGIGHGVTADYPESVWGDTEAMLSPSLEICDRVTSARSKRLDCYIGVYAAAATYYTTGEYGFVLDRQDPLRLCREQAEIHRSSCYQGLVSALMWATGNNFLRAAHAVAEIPEQEYAIGMIRYLAGPVVYTDLKNTNYDHYLSVCHTLPQPLRYPCIEGFINQVVETNGPNGIEAARTFCVFAALRPEERDHCVKYVEAAARR